MQPRKFRILSAITAGSLALAVAAITASSGTSQPATHAALAAQTESFPPVNLDDCPILHTGYPQGPCVAQLQTDLNIIQGNHLTVDGTFGWAGSQTYNAVTAFQQAHGLPQDGIVGPDTKQALEAAIPGDSVPTPTVPPATVPAPSTPTVPLQYVAMGDSYSSGEGEGQFLPDSDTPTDTCHRSTQAYSQYVTPKPDVFAACSGQDTSALYESEMSGQEPPQLSRLDRQSTRLVTLTFGGNNLNWTGMLGDCMKVQTAVLHKTLFYSSHSCYQDLDALQGRIDRMQTDLFTAYKDVLTAAPNAQVRVLNYPPLFPDRKGKISGCRIGRFGPFQEVIAADVEQRVVDGEQKANSAIQAAVTQAQAIPGGDRLQLVDVTSQFGGYTGHTVSCGDTGRPTPWINSLRLSAAQAALWTLDAEGGNWDQLHRDSNDVDSASFHPTPEGQYQMYLALAPTLPAAWH